MVENMGGMPKTPASEAVEKREGMPFRKKIILEKDYKEGCIDCLKPMKAGEEAVLILTQDEIDNAKEHGLKPTPNRYCLDCEHNV